MQAILDQLTLGSTIAKVAFFKEGKDSTGQGERRVLENVVVEGVKANKEGHFVCTVKAGPKEYKSFSVRCVSSLTMATA
jgi:hypothetical protein